MSHLRRRRIRRGETYGGRAEAVWRCGGSGERCGRRALGGSGGGWLDADVEGSSECWRWLQRNIHWRESL